MLPRNCPICGSSEGAQVYAEARLDFGSLDAFAFASRKIPEYMHCRLVRCPRCDLLYADPAFPPQVLAEAYREAAFDSGVEARYAARSYGRFLRRFIHRLPDRRGALDIGTGDGVFLEELLAARFTEVGGVEPSETPVAASRPDIRPLIRLGVFRSGDHPAGRLSLVTCFQTLEHLDVPLEMCREALRILKPGGALYVVSHNRLALANRLLGRKSPIFDLEHLQLFSPRSAVRLFEAAGFERIETRTILNVYPLHYWMKLLPLPKTLKRGMIHLLRATGLGLLPVPLPAGNMAVVGFKSGLGTSP